MPPNGPARCRHADLDAGAPGRTGRGRKRRRSRGTRLRALLILLALEPGRVVASELLVDGIWQDAPPAGATNALQALVSRLRRALPGAAVEAHPAGYRLVVEPDAVDVVRFERLVSAGRGALARDPAAAARLLREALELWRGPALGRGGRRVGRRPHPPHRGAGAGRGLRARADARPGAGGRRGPGGPAGPAAGGGPAAGRGPRRARRAGPLAPDAARVEGAARAALGDAFEE
ncbi:BTAD domain-containing putative transcriptional regulator [Streptomyces sp. NPDC001552]|uniref:AfsR/SARP family transcriptional regulator n=1 Tax=Streptomyces sp. NPDC001552 TaxID=3364587 RepID=UPI00369CF728